MFYDYLTTTKIIPARSLNHSLDTQVSSFKNPTNSRDILLKTLFLTELACGNRVCRTHCNYSRGPKLHQKSIFPTKSNYLQKYQKLTQPPPTIEFHGLKRNRLQFPVELLRVYLKHTENKSIAVIYSTTHVQASPC